MFEHMTVQQATEKWNLSLSWVQRICKEKRINGVMNINYVWLIPKEAEKSTGGRCSKSGDLDEA